MFTSVGSFTHNSNPSKMKQIDFIAIINKHCPVVFQTEFLLQTLIVTAKANCYEDIAILRKCMYNHLSRLEKQYLVKRLSPKGSRNAHYEQLFSLKSPIQVFIKRHDNTQDKHCHNQSLLKSHYSVLQQHIKQLTHKLDAFKLLNDKFDSYSPIINRKLKLLDAELYLKSIEFNAVNELMDEIKKSHVT